MLAQKLKQRGDEPFSFWILLPTLKSYMAKLHLDFVTDLHNFPVIKLYIVLIVSNFSSLD